MADKPEALRMADSLDKFSNPWDKEIASELRRLVAVNQELLGTLNNIEVSTHDAMTAALARAAIAKAEGA